MFIEGKRSHEDISSDEDSDKTPTNERVSEDDTTPNESLNDISDMKNTLEKVKQAAKGQALDKKDFENIKEEYSSYFDEEGGNVTDKEAFDEIIDYLEEEISVTLKKSSLAGLPEALDELAIEPPKKKLKSSESSNTESQAEPSTEPTNTDKESKGNIPSAKPSDGLSPLDYVLDKQSTDPPEFDSDDS